MAKKLIKEFAPKQRMRERLIEAYQIARETFTKRGFLNGELFSPFQLMATAIFPWW